MNFYIINKAICQYHKLMKVNIKEMSKLSDKLSKLITVQQ